MAEEEIKVERSLLINDPFLKQALEARPEAHQLFNRLEKHHKGSAEESVRVAKMAVFLGKLLGYSDEEQLILGRASLMHDVGKRDVPVEILEAGLFGELPPEILKHPETSSQLLMEIGDERVARIVLAHHQFQEKSYPLEKVELDERDYNRFAKTPYFSTADEPARQCQALAGGPARHRLRHQALAGGGKARFQASPETNGKAVESLPEKTLGFQPREAYKLAQILALADQVDALLSKRPYRKDRKAFSVAEAIKILSENEKLPSELIETAVKFRAGLNL